MAHLRFYPLYKNFILCIAVFSQCSLQAQNLSILDATGSVSGLQKIAITRFVVHFVDQDDIHWQRLPARQAAYSEVQLTTALPLQTMQRISQQLYNDTIDQIKAAGLKVLALDELRSKPIWTAISNEGKASPLKHGRDPASSTQGTFVAPFGYRVVFDPLDEIQFIVGVNDPRRDRFMPMALRGKDSDAMRLAEMHLIKSGDATHVLRVRITITPSILSKHTSHQLEASDILPKLGFAPEFTRWGIKGIHHGNRINYSRIYLNKPAEMEGVLKAEKAAPHAVDTFIMRTPASSQNPALISSDLQHSHLTAKTQNLSYDIPIYEKAVVQKMRQVSAAFAHRLAGQWPTTSAPVINLSQ